MSSYLAAFRVSAILGFIVGAVVGALPWHHGWPGLSILDAWKGAALGWLGGAAVAIPLGWTWSRRSAVCGERPRGRWRRVVGVGAIGVALAPSALWLTIAFPGGLLRRAMVTGRAAGDSRPNIILITVEAFRPDRLGAYGSTTGLTPNLDAFAREATQYEAAYVSSSWTTPSLAADLTALSPSQCVVDLPMVRGMTGHSVGYVLARGAPLLPEELRRGGYVTAAELTNHFLSPQRGWSRGFDCYRNESTDENPSSDLTQAWHVTERASEWLGLNHREPFFLWMHYFDPHVPYDSPDTAPDLRARYPRGWAAHPRVWLEGMQFAREPERSRYQEFYRWMYDEEVRYTDRWIGELLKRIKAAGQYDRSLIVVTADHGEELFDRTERGGVEHGHSMHEEVLWVPLLVKWPQGINADPRVEQTVSVADLHGTFLDLAAARARTQDGRGLPLRNGSSGDEVFAEWIYYGAEQTALVTDRYKVIYDPGKDGIGGRFQVYDRRTDREERHDLANTGVAADLQLRLQQLTRAALEQRRLTNASHSGRSLVLSDKAKRDLRSLGYMGK